MIPNIGFRTRKTDTGTEIEGSIIFRSVIMLSEYTQHTVQEHVMTKNVIKHSIQHGLFEWLKEHAPEELNSYYQNRLREEASGYYRFERLETNEPS